MVTCSELATIITTQDNSFLVWGSRPLIKSPLHTMFACSDSDPLPHAGRRRESNVSSSPSRRVSSVTFDIGSSDPVVEEKTGPTPQPLPPGGASGNGERMYKSSSLNLTHIPYTETSCTSPSQYMSVLTQLLPDLLHGGRGGGGRGEGPSGRRGPSVSSEAGSLEGVIVEPTSVDMVGRCGLLSDLSAQGLQQAKLVGVSSFAGNVLILIEAKIPEEKSLKVTPPKQPLLMMSKRLTQRRHWNK